MSRRAGPLSAGQRESLERDGYLLVPSLLDESVLAPMRARLDELVYQTLVAWDADPGQDVEERGVVDAALRLSDPGFAPCREHPLVAEAAAVVFGADWHLGGLELRAPLPGCGHQGLHPDYFPGHQTHGPWRSLSAMWCISAFTPDNGPLRLIPGSHRVDRNPVDALPLGCEMGPHPAEVKVVGEVLQPVLVVETALLEPVQPAAHSLGAVNSVIDLIEKLLDSFDQCLWLRRHPGTGGGAGHGQASKANRAFRLLRKRRDRRARQPVFS